MPRPSAVNPPTPVWDKDVKAELAEKAIPFNVTRVSTFRSPRYGATWRLYAARLDTGEIGIMLFAANAVRDEAMGGFADSLAESNGTDPVGPCNLVERPTPNGRETWEIIDATDESLAALASVRPARATKTAKDKE